MVAKSFPLWRNSQRKLPLVCSTSRGAPRFSGAIRPSRQPKAETTDARGGPRRPGSARPRARLHPSISAHARARVHPHPHHVESRRPRDLPGSAGLEMVRPQIGAKPATPTPLHTAIRPLVIPTRPTNSKKPNNFFSHPQHVSRWYLTNPGAILSHNSHTRITNTKLQTRKYVVRNRAGDHPFTRLGNQRKCSACGFAQRLARPSP